MTARIYKPTKTATQSGIAATKRWVLEFIPDNSKFIDPIMGWTGSSDMKSSELRLFFQTQEEAVRYAKKNGLSYIVQEPKPKSIIIKSYTNNFKYTHAKTDS